MIAPTPKLLLIALYAILAFLSFSSGTSLSSESESEVQTEDPHFINPSSQKYPIKKITYPNGVAIYYAFQKGAYRALPESIKLTISHRTDTLVLGGVPPLHVTFVSLKSHQAYPIKYSSSLGGEVDLFIDINGTLIKIPVNSPPISAPDS